MDVCRPRRHIFKPKVSCSGKKAFQPEQPTYFICAAAGGAPALFFIHYYLLFCINYCPDPVYEGKKLNFFMKIFKKVGQNA